MNMVSHHHAPQNRAQTEGGLAIFSLAGALFFGALAFMLSYMDVGRWAFASAVTMAIAIDLFFWFAVVKHDLRSFALKVGFFSSMIGKIYPLALCFSLPLSQDHLFPWGGYLFESPLLAAWGANVPSVSIALVYLLSRPISPKRQTDVSIYSFIEKSGPRFEWFLIFAGAVKMLYWVSITVLDNPLFYVVRVLNSAMFYAPFFVGMCAFKHRRALYTWLGILGFLLITAFLTGSRGPAFFPILLFGVGFAVGLPNWRQRFRWAVILAPAAAVLLASAVFIGAVRDVVGRTDLATALNEGTLLSSLSDVTVTSNIDYTGGVAYKAFRRLTPWPTYVIPAMTPNAVPYRGFDDFTYEVRAAFGLGIFALISENFQGAYYFGNIFLKPYGFAVHVDAYGKKTSNVELAVFVDAFMRGGWIVAFGFTMFTYSLIFAAERYLRKWLLPHKLPLCMMIMTVLCYLVAIRCTRASMVDSVRMLILEGGFSFVVFYLFDLGLTKMGIRRG
ncbi:hypothetical protein N9R65_02985 [Opitutales bacterium]|nr:hypothetical protein [Opitutales bacterium]MDB2681507.1 hypothetical protein [Opitutales bacterium]